MYKVFDWNKAARIIKKRNPVFAIAGLKEDMKWTSGEIYRNGKHVKKRYTFLASRWATPVLIISTEDGVEEEIECWVWESETKWNAKTFWPKSARNILMEV